MRYSISKDKFINRFVDNMLNRENDDNLISFTFGHTRVSIHNYEGTSIMNIDIGDLVKLIRGDYSVIKSKGNILYYDDEKEIFILDYVNLR